MKNINSSVEQIFSDLSKAYSVEPPPFDEQGRCSVIIDGIPMIIEAADQSPKILFLSIVYEGDPTIAVFEEALAGNLYWLETKGGTFMWDKQAKSLVLCYERPIEGLALQDVIHILTNFSQSVRDWQKRLADLEVESKGGER